MSAHASKLRLSEQRNSVRTPRQTIGAEAAKRRPSKPASFSESKKKRRARLSVVGKRNVTPHDTNSLFIQFFPSVLLSLFPIPSLALFVTIHMYKSVIPTGTGTGGI